MTIRTSSPLLAGAAAVALSLHGRDASAQFYGGVQVGVQAQPQPVYAQPQPVYVQQQPVYVQQPQQPMYAQQPPMYQRQGRIRVGIDGGGGYMLAGGLTGGSLVLSARLGWQLNDNLAFYYQGTLPIGFAAGNIGGSDYSGAAIILGNGFMGEWHFNDYFGLALGPSADYAAGAICASSSSACVGAAGTFFGIQARASLTVAATSAGPNGRRFGFRVGVSSHTSFITGTAFQFFDLHLGYEWF